MSQGKGSQRRPIQVPYSQYADRWEQTFGSRPKRRNGRGQAEVPVKKVAKTDKRCR